MKLLWSWLRGLRTESVILAFGFLCTILVKARAVFSDDTVVFLGDLCVVILPDIVFLAVVFFIISCLYRLIPKAWTVRCVLLFSVLISSWSVVNAGWMYRSGVQLQPGILVMLIRDASQLWPLVRSHLLYSLPEAILLGLVGVSVVSLFLWRLIRPVGIISKGLAHKSGPFFAAGLIILLLLIDPALKAGGSGDFKCEVLGFSSHWHVFVSLVNGNNKNGHEPQSRVVPRAGERPVGVDGLKEDPPNIVIVLLESVPYSATSFGDKKTNATPFLSELADKGVHFSKTRAPVSHTTKALWSVLTSSTPDISADYAEAVPVDRPYESLATILGRVGYSSGFFEMSKGSYECAPGLFSNLGYDWAWFRENLEDPSANIGYLGGDDFRMIEPALHWAKKQEGPFLLTMITTVSHDPYIVPQWFEKPDDRLYERFLQTLRYTDHFLETLCKQLSDSGLDDNTILCVLGDHGTSFGDDPGRARWNPTEEILHVPWVITWPGHVEGGQVVEGACSQLDVAPTLLKLVGFDISQAGFEGRDALTESQEIYRQYFSSWYDQSPMAFIEGDRKCVYWPYLDKVMEYDLAGDPREKKPVLLEGQHKQQVIEDILKWQGDSRIYINAKQHSDAFIYSHWQTFSSGRMSWAYYVP